MAPRRLNRKAEYLQTSEVAEVLGISRRTLLRKLADGTVLEPMRDPNNNYRLWRPEEVQIILQELQRENL